MEVYSVLSTGPTESSLQWELTEDHMCTLSQNPANLEHILSSSQVGLTQGKYTCSHNRLLSPCPYNRDEAEERARTDVTSTLHLLYNHIAAQKLHNERAMERPEKEGSVPRLLQFKPFTLF